VGDIRARFLVVRERDGKSRSKTRDNARMSDKLAAKSERTIYLDAVINNAALIRLLVPSGTQVVRGNRDTE